MDLSELTRVLPNTERGIRQTTRRALPNGRVGQLFNRQLDSERAVPTVGFRVRVPVRAHGRDRKFKAGPDRGPSSGRRPMPAVL